MLSSCFLALCFVAGAVGMTTTHKPHHHHHGTKPSKSPHIVENFYFHVEKNMFAVKHGKECFIYELNGQEREDVKASHGLHLIEKKIIDLVDSNVKGISATYDQVNAKNPKLAHFCGHRKISKIN